MVKKILGKINDLFLNPVNLFFRIIKRPLKPRWIVLEITELCNSRCIHCNIWKTPSTNNPLSPSEIEKALSDKLFENIERVLITGGEPFIRSDLKEIVLRIHKILPKAKIWLSTNAILADQAIKVIRDLLKRDIFIGIGVSLDGLGQEHDKIRGVPGNFEKVDFLLRELSKLKKEYKDKMELAAGFTLSDLTVNSTENIVKYVKKLDIDLTVAIYEQASYYSNLGKKVTKNKKLIKAAKLLPSAHHNKFLLKSLKGRQQKFSCFAMQKFFLLRSDGEVAPCLRLSHLSAGNVRTSSPSNIWRSKEMNEIRQTVIDCSGCLNTWAIDWSFQSYNILPLLYYSLKTRFKKLGIWLN